MEEQEVMLEEQTETMDDYKEAIDASFRSV